MLTILFVFGCFYSISVTICRNCSFIQLNYFKRSINRLSLLLLDFCYHFLTFHPIAHLSVCLSQDLFELLVLDFKQNDKHHSIKSHHAFCLFSLLYDFDEVWQLTFYIIQNITSVKTIFM